MRPASSLPPNVKQQPNTSADTLNTNWTWGAMYFESLLLDYESVRKLGPLEYDCGCG